MKTIPYWLAGLIGVCIACTAAAADAPPARALTLPELTAIALRNHPDTRIAWATLAQSQAAERIARAGWWPTLTASYSAQRSRSIASGGTEVPAQTRYGPSVSLSYLLFDFGTRGGSIERAAAERMASEFSLNQTLQDVVLAVESSYYTVIGSAALADASQQALDEAQANLDAARTKHAAGLATIADVYQAEAARAAAQLTQQRAQGDYRIAQGALAGALGYSPATPLQLVDWAPEQAAIERPALSLGELLDRARRARPQLLAAQASEQAASAAVRAARGNALPTLRLSSSAGQTRVVDRGASEQYSAGLSLSVPLFQGFALRAAIDGARASLDSARASTEALRLTVEQQVWSAYQAVDTAYGNLDASRVQLESAERAAEAIRARYRNGLSSILEVLTTESTLAQARVARIQAFLDWYLALATLAHDAGGLHAAVDSPDTGALP
ncbi:TolC family protein [Solimonas variicoloris]|uniref:TolC family protein n=1 Tax=Solimonas variicoloris TaxID=254408 RepID=UPI00037FDAC3|nr:TolC family protein [Solimonas variicoloris]